MAEDELKELPELLSVLCVRAFEERRFRDALLSAFASYLISIELKDEDCQSGFLVAVKGAIDKLMPADQSSRPREECSFCGRKPPDVRLAAEPNVYICDDCVATLAQTFSSKS
jgi:hypothetical protein